jgi:hypothetical protein
MWSTVANNTLVGVVAKNASFKLVVFRDINRVVDWLRTKTRCDSYQLNAFVGAALDTLVVVHEIFELVGLGDHVQTALLRNLELHCAVFFLVENQQRANESHNMQSEDDAAPTYKHRCRRSRPP